MVILDSSPGSENLCSTSRRGGPVRWPWCASCERKTSHSRCAERRRDSLQLDRHEGGDARSSHPTRVSQGYAPKRARVLLSVEGKGRVSSQPRRDAERVCESVLRPERRGRKRVPPLVQKGRMRLESDLHVGIVSHLLQNGDGKKGGIVGKKKGGRQSNLCVAPHESVCPQNTRKGQAARHGMREANGEACLYLKWGMEK